MPRPWYYNLDRDSRRTREVRKADAESRAAAIISTMPNLTISDKVDRVMMHAQLMAAYKEGIWPPKTEG